MTWWWLIPVVWLAGMFWIWSMLKLAADADERDRRAIERMRAARREAEGPIEELLASVGLTHELEDGDA